MNREKKKLTDRLRTTKDPGERDRIMWALSGLEKGSTRQKPVNLAPTGKTDEGVPPAQKENPPAMPTGVRKFVSYVAPGICLMIGLVNMLEALMRMMQGAQEREYVPTLVTGAIFFMFGITIFIKARKKIARTELETKADER
jgi:hypothetical protein